MDAYLTFGRDHAAWIKDLENVINEPTKEALVKRIEDIENYEYAEKILEWTPIELKEIRIYKSKPELI